MQSELKPTIIVGMGKTGISVARFLHQRGEPLVMVDQNPELNQSEALLEFAAYPSYFGPFSDETKNILLTAKQIIISPGITLTHSIFDLAKLANIPIFGDIELFAQYIQSLPLEQQPVIAAVTGSNGKSTVVSLLAYMAAVAKLEVGLGGNIGVGVFDLIAQNLKLLVLELSSFQLETCKSLAPDVVSLLNLSPDHLDRYPDYQAYVEAKHNIYHQAEMAIVNRHDENSWPDVKKFPKLRVISFGLDMPKDGQLGISVIDNQAYFCFGDKPLLATNEIKLLGTHNQLNALAALSMGYALGIPWAPMLIALKDFEGLEHRCQWVTEKDGVQWINDSKGTNVGATIVALESLIDSITGKIILIAGGEGKAQDFNPLALAAQNKVRHVITIGRDSPIIAKAFENFVPVFQCDKLEEAVAKAQQVAQKGDMVLLSPACASFDQYPNYQVRGKHFMETVNQALKASL